MPRRKTNKEIDSNKQTVLMLGYLCIATEKEASLPSKVKILDKFNLNDPEIALICGCTIPAVPNARLKNKAK
jgi:hypothetical protein